MTRASRITEALDRLYQNGEGRVRNALETAAMHYQAEQQRKRGKRHDG